MGGPQVDKELRGCIQMAFGLLVIAVVLLASIVGGLVSLVKALM
tara:strand:- start:3289 stop:3420 length:132 start_codon:yes stop_codon:yes gene_type:complete